MVLFFADIMFGDRVLRNEEFARWPVQGICGKKGIRAALVCTNDIRRGQRTMRSKCRSPCLEKCNVASVIRPLDMPVLNGSDGRSPSRNSTPIFSTSLRTY